MASLVAAEFLARHYGLHTPVLYERTAYGYRAQPNQDIRRFGNRIFYNAQGLRSEPITPEPGPGVVRILCIGDSITNGGTITDQDSTYPYLLQKLLRERGVEAEVLNASAGGWALGNAQGWLNEHGTFGAQAVVIEVATHDLFQPPAPASTVDEHPSFPSRAPVLALQELLARYLLPRLIPALRARDPGTDATTRDIDMAHAAIDRVAAMIAKASGSGAVPMVLQVEQPAPLEPDDALTRAAKANLRATLAALRVPLIETGDAIARAGGSRLFRDAFHPNAEGNRVLAEAVADALSARDPTTGVAHASRLRGEPSGIVSVN